MKNLCKNEGAKALFIATLWGPVISLAIVGTVGSIYKSERLADIPLNILSGVAFLELFGLIIGYPIMVILGLPLAVLYEDYMMQRGHRIVWPLFFIGGLIGYFSGYSLFAPTAWLSFFTILPACCGATTAYVSAKLYVRIRNRQQHETISRAGYVTIE